MESEFDLMMDLADRVSRFRSGYIGDRGQIVAARVLDWLVAWNVSTDLRDYTADDSRRPPPPLAAAAFVGAEDQPRLESTASQWGLKTRSKSEATKPPNGEGFPGWTPPDDKRQPDKALERELAKAPTPKKPVHCHEAAMTGEMTKADEQPMHVTKAVKDAAAKLLASSERRETEPEEPELRETIKAQVLREVTKALRANGPMSGRQLLIALLEEGVIINGTNPVANLASHIYATTKFQLWPRGWWFKGEELPLE